MNYRANDCDGWDQATDTNEMVVDRIVLVLESERSVRRCQRGHLSLELLGGLSTRHGCGEMGLTTLERCMFAIRY